MKFSAAQKKEIKLRFRQLTSRELYDHLCVNFGLTECYTTYRTELYDLGFYKCRMLRWTNDELQFLKSNYKTSGNIEIAKNLSKKNRVFTKKNIEKKMLLEGIKRSSEDLEYIRNKAVKKGNYRRANFKRWEELKSKEREIRIWKNSAGNPFVVIKINGTFVQFARQRFIEIYGSVPKGCKVFFKDGNFLNWSDDNFIAKPSLNKAEQLQYKFHIDKYLSEEKTKDFKVVEAPKMDIPVEPKLNLISVKINEKLTVKVKPGTDIEKLRQRYNSHLSNALRVSNFNPLVI